MSGKTPLTPETTPDKNTSKAYVPPFTSHVRIEVEGSFAVSGVNDEFSGAEQLSTRNSMWGKGPLKQSPWEPDNSSSENP